MKSLTRIYILALLLIGGFIISGHFIVLHVVQEQSGDARIINLSGRQRMLSQYITKHAILSLDSSLVIDADSFYVEYERAIQQFSKAHKALQFGNDSLLIPEHLLSEEVSSLFQSIEPHFNIIEREGLTIARKNNLDKKAKQQKLLMLLAAEKSFLPLMDKITFQFEREANAKIKRLQLLETILQATAIIILILIAYFIFRPVVQKNKYYLKKLETSNNSLKNSNEELVASRAALERLTGELLESQEEFKLITEELQLTNRTLSESQTQLERLSLVAQKTTNGIVITNPEGYTEWVNKGFTELTGYTAKEVIGKKPGTLLQGRDTNPETIKSISEKLHRKEIIEVDILNYTKVGSPYWIHMSITPIFNSEGEHDGFIAIESDVSERKEMELLLKENNTFLEEINKVKVNLIKEKDINKSLPETLRVLKSLARVEQVCIFRNFLSGNRLNINLLYTDLRQENSEVETDFVWELPETERLSNSWYNRLQKGEKLVLGINEFPQGIKARLNAKKVISILLMPIFIENTFFGFITFESIDGEKRWDNLQEFSYQSVVNAIGSIIQRNDILKQLEDSQQKLQQLNEKVNFELDSFFYSASHDLRRPVTTALGLIDLANQAQDNEEKGRYLTFLQETIVKLDRLILDIIQISKNKTLEVNRTDNIQFEDFFQGIINDLKYYDDVDKITIVVDNLQENPFSSDSKRLKSVFSNIIANAIKYHNLYQESPQIEIIVRASKDNAIILIKDNGTGIPAEHLNKLFDVFYRANESKSGSGLGLYIARETIIKLGGEIKVESELGLGTTFCIDIPNYYSAMKPVDFS